jgi:hypothetical protein
MSILSPDHELIAKVAAIVDDVNELYSKELEMNNDVDDIYSLADMLNERCNGLSITWEVDDDPRGDPNEWISAMAGTSAKGNVLYVYLWEQNIAQKWGPKTFKELVLGMLGHETIRFHQYEKIGLDNISKVKSGHQKGAGLGGAEYMRCYLSDPHELMAYGFDLAADIKASDKPDKSLRSPEAHREELPVYNQYRRFFEKDSKEMKRLLSYAARYQLADD